MFDKTYNNSKDLIRDIEREFDLKTSFIVQLAPIVDKIFSSDFPEAIKVSLMKQLQQSIEFQVAWETNEKALKKEIQVYRDALAKLMASLKETLLTTQKLAKQVEMQKIMHSKDEATVH